MKRDPALVTLSREHHTALSLAKRVKEASASGDPGRIERARSDVAAFFVSDLAAHFASEEATILVGLAEAGERALVERTLAEHRALRELVDDLFALPPVAEAARHLVRFAELLAAHVRFEERELFQCVQAQLELHEKDAACAARPCP